MINITKKTIVLIIIIMFIIGFSSSYCSLNIDNLAFVSAIGIDVSDTKTIKVTFQFVNPPSTSEGSNQNSKIIIDTVDASSITNAINTMNAYLAKKLDMSHCKMIVFSEEIAQKGLSNYIYSLMNDVQVRPTSNIIIAKCSAYYYIENSKPTLETLVTRYYDTFSDSSKYTGYMPNATIGYFFNALVCNYCQPYAILGGTSSSSNTSSDENSSFQNYSVTDSNIKSGSSSISGTRNTENIGTAVFHEDKLVGELDASETMCLLILTNKVDTFLITVSDPEDKNLLIDIYLTPKSDGKVNVDIINGSPYVKVNIAFFAQIYSMNKDYEYLSTEVLNSISENCNKYLESMISAYLYKTSLSFKTDITGLGQYVLPKFATNQEFDSYNWDSNFVNATFDIKINTIMDSGFLITQT